METKFYVGQRVRGTHGQVVIVLDPKHNASIFKGILVDGPIENQPIGYISSGWLKDSFVDFPIYPPRVVLTEWQKQKLKDHFLLGYKYASEGMDWYSLADYNLAQIESILSSPEPPKYQPKQGEAVIFRDRKDCPWSASVATGIYWRIYYYGDTLDAFEVRPFDASLVGKVTND